MESQKNQNSWRNTENEEQSQRYPTLISTLQSYSDGGSDGKEFACDVGDLGSIPASGRSSGEGNGYMVLQCSCLENPMDRGTWWVTVHGAAESQTQLSN